MPKLKRWNWSARTGSSRVMRELTAHGTTWMRAPGMAEKALVNPWMTAVEILGTVPSRIEMCRIAAVQKTDSYVNTDDGAGFHVDPHRWGATWNPASSFVL